MSTALSVVADSPAEIPDASPVAGVDEPVKSELEEYKHRAYAMKLAGKRISEISQSFQRNRSTLWRWFKQIEREAEKSLEGQSAFNIISQEIAGLNDIERKCRAAAETATSLRAKMQCLAEARRAATQRQNLMISVGILPKAPDQIFRITSDLRITSARDNPQKRLERSREQLLSDVLTSLDNLACLE